MVIRYLPARSCTMYSWRLNAIFCSSFLLFLFVRNSESKDSYTGAVYEHATIFSIEKTTQTRNGALEIMRKNLAVFQTRTQQAKAKGAEIIVFPEDGLYGFGYSREGILPFLEVIPEPSDLQKKWNPCMQPDRFNNTEVLRKLSCIAKNSSIAVVANMGDVQYCEKSDPHCPGDGRYQFNTDVAFDTDGTFLAKYHKQHLYHEDAFNTPQKAGIVTFNTSFGVTFGVFTCFDMLFYDPAIELVEKLGIRNIVFPTAWMDGFPILASVEYQQAWSRRTGVNLLAANQHQPLFDMVGSGIYSCGEAKKYVYDTKSYDGHLLVAELDNLDFRPGQNSENCPANGAHMTAELKKQEHFEKWHPMLWELSPKLPFLPLSGKPFHSKLLNDMYTFVKLDDPQGNVSVCADEFCCQGSYSTVGQQPFKTEMFALGAFSGRHDPENYFIQTCVLIKCADMTEKSCGEPTQVASTVFMSFSVMGNFSSKVHVYPEVLGSSVELISPKETEFDGHEMSVKTFNRSLISAVLFGRIYEWDSINN